MEKLTVYTPTFNREKLLPRAIESVLSQTFTDFEYVILNNGCTDGTQDVINTYMRQDTRIKCICNKKNRIVFDSNDPLYIPNGDNVFFTQVDDDDYIDPYMIETLYRLAIDTRADICSVGSKFVFADGSEKDKYVFDGKYSYNRIEAMYELLKREKINSARGGKLYKKELMMNFDYPKVHHMRDIHREYRVINRIEKMTVTGKPMYYFYRHNKNLSGLNTKDQITIEKMNEHLLANRIRTEYLTKRMPEISNFALYSEYSFMISLTDRIRKLSVEECFRIADQMAETLRKNTEWLMACGYLKPQEIEIMETL